MARDSFFIDDVVKIADYLGMKVVLKGEKEYIIGGVGNHTNRSTKKSQ